MQGTEGEEEDEEAGMGTVVRIKVLWMYKLIIVNERWVLMCVMKREKFPIGVSLVVVGCARLLFPCRSNVIEDVDTNNYAEKPNPHEKMTV